MSTSFAYKEVLDIETILPLQGGFTIIMAALGAAKWKKADHAMRAIGVVSTVAMAGLTTWHYARLRKLNAFLEKRSAEDAKAEL
jgi:hypothetical protein